MVSIVYAAPTSISEAVGLLTQADMPANILAGGTDLLIQAKSQAGSPASRLFVDVKKISSMTRAELTPQGLALGPSMSCAAFAARDELRALYPGLVEAAALIGSTQIQGRASLGGNLCNASPAADVVPALIALSAEGVIAGPQGERRVAVEDFVTGVGSNCMQEDELLSLLRVPRPDSRTSDAYLRFIPRSEMDIAVVGAAVSLSLDESGICQAARVSIGAVAPTALLVPEAAAALIGTALDAAALAAAASAARAAASPISDRRGTAEYRQHLVGVLVQRATRIAAERVANKTANNTANQ